MSELKAKDTKKGKVNIDKSKGEETLLLLSSAECQIQATEKAIFCYYAAERRTVELDMKVKEK